MSAARDDEARSAAAGWAGFYDWLAPDYDDWADRVGWSANDAARALLAPLGLAPDRVLDLGAGTGLTARMLASLYPGAELTLVDVSPAMVEQARQAFPSAELVVADAAGFLRDTPGQWDLVVVVGVLELVPDMFEVLERAATHLVPSGHLLASHEPIVPGPTVQATGVSVVRGGYRVQRFERAEVARRAATYGLRQVATSDVVAFHREGDGSEALDELVVWTRDA
ncbi:Methyltransferase domain-containing protein [Nocardioides exalbidus]|uniref:Methyltransferase domain-containing protein n=1 Tax=Nocardioides exalbidus TaxID=402596 RepID=A0A1H4YU69_9ACTN|nr:class I SAM-dependent methyltransferase [Nocardioides exalbidus]SED21599.1 Methyltransferase domain-containing protein [Nocardioides exalbidus]